MTAIEADYRRSKLTSIVSTVVAIVALVSGMVDHASDRHAQAALEEYKLTFGPKKAAYSSFLRAVLITELSTVKGEDESALHHEGTDMEWWFYELEPFLSPASRTDVRNTYTAFLSHSLSYHSDSEPVKRLYQAKSFETREHLRSVLYSELFGDRPR